MCAFADSTSSSSDPAETTAPQPTSRHLQRFATAPLPSLDADDEVDLRVENLVNQPLVGRDAHLAAAVQVVPRLLALVLVEIETGHIPLVLEHADRVPAVLV